jgi:hypothetical protein
MRLHSLEVVAQRHMLAATKATAAACRCIYPRDTRHRAARRSNPVPGASPATRRRETHARCLMREPYPDPPAIVLLQSHFAEQARAAFCRCGRRCAVDRTPGRCRVCASNTRRLCGSTTALLRQNTSNCRILPSGSGSPASTDADTSISIGSMTRFVMATNSSTLLRKCP